jgi:hypothetical protein
MHISKVDDEAWINLMSPAVQVCSLAGAALMSECSTPVWIKKLIPCFGPVQSMLIVVDLRGLAVSSDYVSDRLTRSGNIPP